MNQKIGVLVNCPINKENRQKLAENFDLHYAEEVPDRDALLAEVGESISIIISDGPRYIDAALMDQMPNLALICLQSVGLDHLDVDAVKERGIKVTNARGTNSASCADHVFALLLSVSRHILANDKSMRENEAYEECPKFHSTTVNGKKIGILGLGSIGCEIAKRATAFDMEVFYHNRNAGLDVVGGEAPEREPLCTMENVVMSPHLAGNTEESWLNRSNLTRQILMEFREGEKLTNQVY
ncbi:MAG: hypothetical protein HON14_11310 [Rhodospirillaceae bacterium]|nr:hypothetical protein [Rhodospirillaceae bacterium]